MRKEIDFGSLKDTIQKMVEENAAAASIIDNLITVKGESNALFELIILDDMNIRGVQISALYKMSGSDIEKFYENVINLTKEDIENLNFNCAFLTKFKAVFEGTKEDRKLNPEKYMFTEEELNKVRNIKNKNKVKDILQNNPKPKEKVKPQNQNIEKKDDLYPSINTKKALEIIKNHGFTCGYELIYDNKDSEQETYRVFYNEVGDILYSHSLNDIFSYKNAKLNTIRKKEDKTKTVDCDKYLNNDEVIGYNIDLREIPFAKYSQITSENKVENLKEEYFNNNLIPVIETVESIKYKEKNHNYNGLIAAYIYDLFMFEKTYQRLDSGLKKIYEPLLNTSKQKAYDEIIYHLNYSKGIDIAIEIKHLGINLDRNEMFNAKARYYEKNKQDIPKPRFKFLSSLFSDDSWNDEISRRINKVLDVKIAENAN